MFAPFFSFMENRRRVYRRRFSLVWTCDADGNIMSGADGHSAKVDDAKAFIDGFRFAVVIRPHVLPVRAYLQFARCMRTNPFYNVGKVLPVCNCQAYHVRASLISIPVL